MGGWADFSEEEFTNCASGVARRGVPVPVPLLLFDNNDALVGLCMLGIFQIGEMKMLNHRYMDGTKEAFETLLRVVPAHAHGLGCSSCGGYFPASLPWLTDLFENHPGFERGTQTE